MRCHLSSDIVIPPLAVVYSVTHVLVASEEGLHWR